MADYSEFPTTPTAWQDAALRDAMAHEVAPPPQEEPPPPPQRRLDLTALIPGLLFSLLALGVLVGIGIPGLVFDGGLLWLLLIGAGVALLVSELRRSRRR